jgi:hypothetical protein
VFKCGATTFQHGYTVVEARSVANISVEELDALENHVGVGLMALHFMYGSKTDGLGVLSFLKELAQQLGPSVTNERAPRMRSQAVSFAIDEGLLKPYYPVLNSLHLRRGESAVLSPRTASHRGILMPAIPSWQWTAVPRMPARP